MQQQKWKVNHQTYLHDAERTHSNIATQPKDCPLDKSVPKPSLLLHSDPFYVVWQKKSRTDVASSFFAGWTQRGIRSSRILSYMLGLLHTSEIDLVGRTNMGICCVSMRSCRRLCGRSDLRSPPYRSGLSCRSR